MNERISQLLVFDPKALGCVPNPKPFRMLLRSSYTVDFRNLLTFDYTIDFR